MDNNKKLTLICGAPRSGSTLLYNSICSSNIFNIGLTENHFIPNILKLLKKQIFRNQKENFMHFKNNDETIKFFKEIINRYLEGLYDRYQINNLCLKSILFSSESDFISKVLPSAYLIFIVRDPKDIISSMLNVSKKQIKMGVKPNYPRDMNALCDFINKHYEFILKSTNSEVSSKILLIKYEDLVLDTLQTLNFIMNNLELNYMFKNDEELWSRSPSFSDPKKNPYHSDLWNKKPSSDKIGSYKNELTKNEIKFINQSCEKLIHNFKY